MYLHPLIAQIPAAERASLVQSSKLHSYRSNEIVLGAEEWSEHIYCVASGLLRVTVSGIGDSDDVTTDFIRKDDFFLCASFSEDRYQAGSTLVTALPSSVYLIPVSTMRKVCSKYPEVTLGLLELTMKRTALFRGQLRRNFSLTSENLVGRVLHELTQLAPAGADVYDKRITQAVIASYTGLSREVVNRAIRDLEQRGLVRRDEDGIHVPDDFAPSDFGTLLALEQDLDKMEMHQAGPMFSADLLDDFEGGNGNVRTQRRKDHH